MNIEGLLEPLEGTSGKTKGEAQGRRRFGNGVDFPDVVPYSVGLHWPNVTIDFPEPTVLSWEVGIVINLLHVFYNMRPFFTVVVAYTRCLLQSAVRSVQCVHDDLDTAGCNLSVRNRRQLARDYWKERVNAMWQTFSLCKCNVSLCFVTLCNRRAYIPASKITKNLNLK